MPTGRVSWSTKSSSSSHTTDVGSITERFDIALDAVGVIGPQDAGRLLAHEGRLLLLVASLGQTVAARGAVKAGPARERASDFSQLLELVDSGDLRVVLEKELPLVEIVAAHRLVDSGRKVGNVVVLLLAAQVDLPRGLLHWMLMILGMAWQCALSLLLLRREGALRGPEVKHRIRCTMPADPRTDQPRARLWW